MSIQFLQQSPAFMHNKSNPEKCILCGRCLEVCPIFKVTGNEAHSPRGKAFLLDHYLENDIRRKSAVQLAELCAGCKRCLDVCPQKLNLPLRIARLKSTSPDWRFWIWSRMLQAGAKVLPTFKNPGALIPAGLPVLRQALTAPVHAPSLLRPSRTARMENERAVVFPGCVGRHFRPGLTQKAFQMLELLGYNVLETPEWECCGYPLGSAGLFEQEQKAAEMNIRLWDTLGRPLVFVFCATCLDGLEASFGDYDDVCLNDFRQRVRSLTAYIAALEYEHDGTPGDVKLYWHEPCHGHGNSGIHLKNSLASVGLELSVLRKKCCGMGGSFSIQHPGLSSSIAQDFWENTSQDENSMIITDCSGCLLQLEAFRPKNVFTAHWLDIVRTDA